MNSPPSLSPKEALILQLLTTHPEMYGLMLVNCSCGSLKRGTIYVTLGRMEAKGYVKSREEPRAPNVSGLPRRLYSPTEYGVQVLEIWQKVAVLLSPLQPPLKVTP